LTSSQPYRLKAIHYYGVVYVVENVSVVEVLFSNLILYRAHIMSLTRGEAYGVLELPVGTLS